MVIPRFAWRRLFQQRLVVLLSVVAMVWPLLCGVFIYLANNAELLKGFGKQFQSFVAVNGSFFLVFMVVQASFAVFLAALTGPGLIAPDLANNALPLYFSRPLSRLDYALGKLATLFGMLSCVTWIPGLLLFGMQVGMAGGEWFQKNWKLGPGVIAGFGLWILLVSLVAMASSAYARIRPVAGGLILGFFFILGGASGLINGILRVTWGHALNPAWACYQVWCALLKVDPASGPGVPACASVLFLLMLLLALVIERKVRPVEVIP
jgi:ABC-2 type transport system permease protein